ncbi:MAG: hypothetical protein RR224_07050, partial [Clostridia bacterium]
DAGNVFTTENDVANQIIQLDLYAVGQNVQVSECSIEQSALLAGQEVHVTGTSIGGSLRAAGYTLYANDTNVFANATMAGYSIDLGSQFSAKGIYAAASTIRYAGICDTLNVTGQTVTILGTINGDAYIYAERVIVESAAVIKGTLHVNSSAEPSIASGASVSNLEFEQMADSEPAETVKVISPILTKLKSLVMMLPGRILLAVLLFFVLGSAIKGAADMAKTRPVAMPVCGFIALIATPTAALILLITYVGIPAGALVLCLYALVLAFSVSFVGCAAGQLVFSKLHGLLASIIGVSICSLIVIIPYLGGLLRFVCMVYTLGYFLQKIYLGFGKKPTTPKSEPLTPIEISAGFEEKPKQ